MAIRYEVMEETLIPNTTMTKKFLDGEFKAYDIAPNNGYVLHDNTLDVEEFDPETLEPTGRIKRGYYSTAVSCWHNYDFEGVTEVDGYAAYGSRELFARPVSEVTER